MDNNLDKVPTIKDPVLLDRILLEMQKGLAGLPWLDAAFGRAQRLARMGEGGRFFYPAVYCGGWRGHGPDDYIGVSPDAMIGNFSFFDITDPHTISPGPWTRTIRSPYGLVVWYDLRRVYGERDNRNTEALKDAVLKLLSGRATWHLSMGRMTIDRIYERAENIYRGYSLSEIDNQFLMHPYGGFRLEGILEYEEECQW